MYLRKQKILPNTNTYKYYSRDQALDRLEDAINVFLYQRKANSFKHLAEIYPNMSLKDKKKYLEILMKIDIWLTNMEENQQTDVVSGKLEKIP